jgi:hypothetical protein
LFVLSFYLKRNNCFASDALDYSACEMLVGVLRDKFQIRNDEFKLH